MGNKRSDLNVTLVLVCYIFILYAIGKSNDCRVSGCTRIKTSGSKYCYTHSQIYNYGSSTYGNNSRTCYVDYCSRSKTRGGNYCIIHTCLKSDCTRRVASDSIYCTYHKPSTNTKNSYTYYSYPSSNNSTSKKKYDPYDVYDYDDADDFADDWEDEFDDWFDAWEYYEDHH